MNKTELINEISGRIGTTKKNADAVVTAFVDVVTDELSKGEVVSISGFGKFEVVDRAARKARNPQTGEEIEVDPYKAPRFRPSKSLKDAVKG